MEQMFYIDSYMYCIHKDEYRLGTDGYSINILREGDHMGATDWYKPWGGPIQTILSDTGLYWIVQTPPLCYIATSATYATYQYVLMSLFPDVEKSALSFRI